jgi:hypothetical protein
MLPLKKSIVLALLVAFCFPALAQVDKTTFIAVLSPQISLPLGDLAKTNALGIGGSLNGELKVSKKGRALLGISGCLFQGKTYALPSYGEDSYPAVSLFAVKGGYKHFVLKNIFCSGRAGLARATQSGEESIGFAYSPEIGVEFGSDAYYDVTLRYEAAAVKTTGGNNLSLVSFALSYHL